MDFSLVCMFLLLLSCLGGEVHTLGHSTHTPTRHHCIPALPSIVCFLPRLLRSNVGPARQFVIVRSGDQSFYWQRFFSKIWFEQGRETGKPSLGLQVLALSETGIQFAEPISTDSQLPVTLAPRDLVSYSGLQRHPNTHIHTQTDIDINR